MAVTVESMPPLIATNILPLLVMISRAKVGKKEEEEEAKVG